jgi:hypothetical protein
MTTTVNMGKIHRIGCGYVEMPQDGRRFRFHVERFRDDEGHEWGTVLGMEEIPDVGEYLIIPSLGVEPSELEHMEAEYRYEKANPTDQDLAWQAHRSARKAHLKEWYRDMCDQRRTEARGNQHQFLVTR